MLTFYNEMEFMVRGLGYSKSKDDLRKIPIGSSPQTGTPIYLENVATISFPCFYLMNCIIFVGTNVLSKSTNTMVKDSVMVDEVLFF